MTTDWPRKRRRRCTACGECVSYLTPIFRLCKHCHDGAFAILAEEPDKDINDALAEVAGG